VKPLTLGRSPGWMGRADPGTCSHRGPHRRASDRDAKPHAASPRSVTRDRAEVGQDAQPTVQIGGGAGHSVPLSLELLHVGGIRPAENKDLRQRDEAGADEQVYGPEHPEVATDLSHLAVVLRDLGNATTAGALRARAAEIRARLFRSRASGDGRPTRIRGAVRGTNHRSAEHQMTAMTPDRSRLRARDTGDQVSDRPPEAGLSGSNRR
jgi:hypothetical protein